MTRALFTAALLATLVLVASGARADVVPPGPPADDCTVDKQCSKDGQTCPTLGGEVDKDCAAGMAKSGLALKCVQNKATAGKAVFCPASTGKKGCGKSSIAPYEGGEGRDGVAAFGLIAAGLAVAALRRARSRR